MEIARGFIHNPKVLFLDEPTIGLDPQTRRKIWDYVQKLNKETKLTIMLTTHYIEEADELCNRVAIIDHGRIIKLDTPERLKDSLGGDIIRVGSNKPGRARRADQKEQVRGLRQGARRQHRDNHEERQRGDTQDNQHRARRPG